MAQDRLELPQVLQPFTNRLLQTRRPADLQIQTGELPDVTQAAGIPPREVREKRAPLPFAS
jgi:hypothetical protein